MKPNLILGKGQQNWQNLAILTKKIRDKTQITKTRNESVDFTTDLTEIKMIIREYSELIIATNRQLC